MKRKSKRIGKPMFFIVTILVLVFSFCSFFGIEDYYGDVRKLYVKGAKDIRWGIDIRGGVEAIYTPKTKDANISREDMDASKEIFETRMLNNNISDYEVYTDYDNHQIIVRFPWQSDDESYDAQQALEEIGETALLTFRKGSSSTDPVVLQGAADIASASPSVTENNEFVVALKLTSAGTAKFATATKEQLNKTISIWLDDDCISNPTVNNVITTGEAIISGMASAEEAEELANKINAGSLPFELELIKAEEISPTFSAKNASGSNTTATTSSTAGAQPLNVMLIAGVVAFAAICVLMIVFYRLPGVIACIALLGQAAGMIACISGFFKGTDSFTMTLPGIAGIILAIGFGVDANVITAERIKEEFRKGKTIDGAISQGYSNAFSSILDGNITNVIVALVLLAAFGTPNGILSRALHFVFPFLSASVTGNIYSFGYTLIVGVIMNFIMGVWASRVMLMGVSRFKFLRKPWLYGAPKTKEIKSFDYVGFLKKATIIASSILAVCLILTCILGVKTDITFSGGSRFTYNYTGEVNAEEIEQKLQKELGLDADVSLNEGLSDGSKSMVILVSGDLNNSVNKGSVDKILGTLSSTVSSTTSSTESSASSTVSSDVSSSTSSTTSSAVSSNTSSTTSSAVSSNSSTTSKPEKKETELFTGVKTAITGILARDYKDNKFTESESNIVNPTLAGSFFVKAIFAVVLSAVLVIIYIGIRFRKIGGVSAGVSAFIALLHDVAIAFFASAIFGLAVDTNLCAVILTLFGYSLNATIVMFDRVRENQKLYPALTIREQVNKSINETVKRSIVTSVTTFISIATIAIVGEIFGVTALRSFAIPMAIGVVAGCFSSICLAGPIWVKWCEKASKK